MCSACAVHVQCMCSTCALRVHCVCTACAVRVYVLCMCHGCSRTEVLSDGGLGLGLALDIVAEDELDRPVGELAGDPQVDEAPDAGRLQVSKLVSECKRVRQGAKGAVGSERAGGTSVQRGADAGAQGCTGVHRGAKGAKGAPWPRRRCAR